MPIVWRDISYEYAMERTSNADEYFRFRSGIRYDFTRIGVNDIGCVEFSGIYPSNLFEEIYNYWAGGASRPCTACPPWAGRPPSSCCSRPPRRHGDVYFCVLDVVDYVPGRIFLRSERS